MVSILVIIFLLFHHITYLDFIVMSALSGGTKFMFTSYHVDYNLIMFGQVQLKVGMLYSFNSFKSRVLFGFVQLTGILGLYLIQQLVVLNLRGLQIYVMGLVVSCLLVGHSYSCGFQTMLNWTYIGLSFYLSLFLLIFFY